jgi:hypothetical protein
MQEEGRALSKRCCSRVRHLKGRNRGSPPPMSVRVPLISTMSMRTFFSVSLVVELDVSFFGPRHLFGTTDANLWDTSLPQEGISSTSSSTVHEHQKSIQRQRRLSFLMVFLPIPKIIELFSRLGYQLMDFNKDDQVLSFQKEGCLVEVYCAEGTVKRCCFRFPRTKTYRTLKDLEGILHKNPGQRTTHTTTKSRGRTPRCDDTRRHFHSLVVGTVPGFYWLHPVPSRMATGSWQLRNQASYGPRIISSGWVGNGSLAPRPRPRPVFSPRMGGKAAQGALLGIFALWISSPSFTEERPTAL